MAKDKKKLRSKETKLVKALIEDDERERGRSGGRILNGHISA
jgi:hypothetical protein